jgi:hypothetical protein
MLDFVNKFQKMAFNSNIPINMENNLFKFRAIILKLAFTNHKFSF